MRGRVKKKVWERDKYLCRYCGDKLSPETATIDHIIPRSALPKGKKMGESNLTTSCIGCNRLKAARIDLPSCIIMPSYKVKRYETIKR